MARGRRRRRRRALSGVATQPRLTNLASRDGGEAVEKGADGRSMTDHFPALT
ncbi:hypothetical protein PAXINDRAFT_17857 [Paxillus involutus ATCC 200175]|uniref:Uncharacterized protein n=1 Tax=Paxillus involutus ATCC 200175 TaxID=664439 RepID=A0A0C9TMQ0_PAXIN|nr:hypothetical protein PAXINDRAFT_17857 [Paxillus involutus ATCC 200175]